MTVNHSFQTLFAVPMKCDSCVKDVSEAVHKLGGIAKVEASLADQLVVIEGTAPPSAIVDAIQATGRDAILRGSGSSDSAAVSILETYQHLNLNETPEERHKREREVKGLARMVQVSPAVTLVDLTVRGVSPGQYRVTVREYGDLKDGALSAGPIWSGPGAAPGPSPEGPASIPRGVLGVVHVDKSGRGSAYLESRFQVWEVIGHAMMVCPLDETTGERPKNDADTVVGVIARSAGMWGNDKAVCACSGKTIWEERTDEVQKGMF
ncbi:hypothetical protein RB594_001343 [Gaeumannomyces avenae]